MIIQLLFLLNLFVYCANHYLRRSYGIIVRDILLSHNLYSSLWKLSSERSQNNTVFITISTYGYNSFTYDFYVNNNIRNYNQFFVVVHEITSYNV